MKKKRTKKAGSPKSRWRKILLTMRFSLILFFSCLIQVSASTYSQNTKLTINLENASLKKLFKVIKKQSEYTFVYNVDDIEKVKNLDVDFSQSTVNEILDVCLLSTDMTYQIKDKVVILMPADYTKSEIEAILQGIEIKGKITDKNGIALPGVNISVKGTTIGVSSNVDGDYTILVPGEESVLVFSFVGMVEQEINVGGQTAIDIVMEENLLQLDEVVVTGLAGTTSKKKLTFTLENVTSEDLKTGPSLNAASALEGKVAGVRIVSNDAPGGGTAILLRGATSLRTGNEPLIVVDGVLTAGTIRDINPQDIKNVEILKGASAASLYGSRAANGVIAIYTNRGLDNDIGQTRVRFRTEYGFEKVYASRAPEKVNHHAWLTNPDGSIQLDTDGRGIDDPENIYDNPFLTTYDQVEQFFTGSPYTTNYLEVSNRSEKSNILFSAEYTDRKGALANHKGNQRINLRLNADQYMGKKVKVGSSILLAKQKFDTSPTDIENLLMGDPSDNLLKPNPDGTPYNVYGNKFTPAAAYVNPLYFQEYNDDNRDRYRVLGSFDLNYFITDNLTFESRYGMDYLTNIDRHYRDQGYLAVGVGNFESGEIERGWRDEMAVTATQTLSYVKSFNNSLNVKTRLFYQYESEKDNRFWVEADSLGSVRNFDNFDAVPNANRRIITAGSTSPREITGHNFALASSFDYADKYILDFVVRHEGISLFGENERWQTFYRISGAYRLSEEFTIPQVQELSLRASYGTAGGRPLFLDQYEYANVIDGTPFPPTQKGNPDIKPNTTSEMELSLRVDFLERFSLLASYSAQENKDQILRLALSAASGYSSQVVNAGTVSNKTYEFSLGYQAIKKTDMTLDFTLLADRTTQKITEFEPTPYRQGLQWIKEGNSLTNMYGMKFATTLDEVANQLPDGEILEDYYTINRDGYVIVAGTEFTSSESVIRIRDDDGAPISTFKIGNSAPDLTFGLTTNFRYKAFNFYMLWGGQLGGNTYNRGLQRMTQYGLSGMYDQSGYPVGQRKYGAYYQSIYNAVEYVDYWVEDASYLKLRQVVLSYNLRSETLKNLKVGNIFENIRISISGRNLLLFSNYSSFDPSTYDPDSDNPEIGGINNREDYFAYPLTRVFTGSLEFTF